MGFYLNTVSLSVRVGDTRQFGYNLLTLHVYPYQQAAVIC